MSCVCEILVVLDWELELRYVCGLVAKENITNECLLVLVWKMYTKSKNSVFYNKIINLSSDNTCNLVNNKLCTNCFY